MECEGCKDETNFAISNRMICTFNKMKDVIADDVKIINILSIIFIFDLN